MKTLKNILKNALKIVPLALALSFWSCSVKNSPYEIKENKDTINFLGIYIQDCGCRSLGYNIPKNLKETQEQMQKEFDRPVKLILDSLTEKHIMYDADSQKIESVSELYRKQLDSLLTINAIKNGKIDYAVMELHSEPQLSYITCLENRETLNEEEYHNFDLRKEGYSSGGGGMGEYYVAKFPQSIKLTTKDLKKIAQENPYSKEIFSENALVLYKGCSAGKGENSIAETFSQSYNVETQAPIVPYSGGVICKNKELHLNSREFPDTSLGNASLYQSPDNKNYIFEHTYNETFVNLDDNEVFYLEDFVEKELSKNYSKELERAYKDTNVTKQIELLGFKLLEANKPFSYFMETRTFNKN